MPQSQDEADAMLRRMARKEKASLILSLGYLFLALEGDADLPNDPAVEEFFRDGATELEILAGEVAG